ncbi:PAS domain-containing protein [Sphingomonas bacterium]|uniref:PAS domain-containing protein n=1 Tax=Sphingomonas bacterium TaxID=1895847 RepID=UPI001C2D5C1D|nr:PAS domain-containing protein [Sphingomonas bacterium]
MGQAAVNEAEERHAATDAERIAAELIGLDVGTDPFVAAVRATRMPMVISNPRLPDNPIVFANGAFCRLSGYPRDEILGRNCRFLQGPGTDRAMVAHIGAAIRRVEPVEIDLLNYRKDGEPFWNRLLMAPVFDTDGVLAYFFASQVDVTIERERLAGLESDNAALMAELTDRLRHQEEREHELAFTLKAGGFGTWSLEPRTRTLTASDTCKGLFGQPVEAPFSFSQWIAAVHPDDRRHAVDDAAGSVAAGSDFTTRYRIHRPDGEMRWISSHGQPFFTADRKLLRIAGVSVDITGRQREEQFRMALVELSDAVRDGTNPAEISFAAAEVIGRTMGVDRAGYGLVDRAAETITIERDWNAPGVRTLAGTLHFRDYGSYIDDLKRGGTAIVSDARVDPRTADTAPVLEAINARSFINMPVTEHGGFVALLYLNHGAPRVWRREELAFLREAADRTRIAVERRRAEQDLAELAASLEQQVVERTTSLQVAEEALRQSQKMEAVGQLTGGVAHDFNNLLTVIRSATDLLKRPGLSEERRARYVDAISDTADRAAKLTGQLLAFARRQALKPETVDVAASLRTISDMLGTLTGSRIAIEMALPDEPCFIEVDPSQFDTALVNMVVNARDAMDGEGRIAIAVRAARTIPALRAHPAENGDFIAVSIADTGSGIAADQIDRIFEPFYTTKGVGQGTGLGLSQVFGFAKQSGGDIAVDSATGKGTVFTMFLPRTDAPVPAPTGGDAGSQRPADGHGTRVLVVEDNADVGSFTTNTLQELGYETTLAANADEALAELSHGGGERFDIVFSDVVMPGMNGIQLGEAIRAAYPGLPVVLTSGYSSVLAQNGTHGFELLHKPYSVEQLSRVLRSFARRPSQPS